MLPGIESQAQKSSTFEPQIQYPLNNQPMTSHRLHNRYVSFNITLNQVVNFNDEGQDSPIGLRNSQARHSDPNHTNVQDILNFLQKLIKPNQSSAPSSNGYPSIRLDFNMSSLSNTSQNR